MPEGGTVGGIITGIVDGAVAGTLGISAVSRISFVLTLCVA